MYVLSYRVLPELRRHVSPYAPHNVRAHARIPSHKIRRGRQFRLEAKLDLDGLDHGRDNLVRDALKQIDQYCWTFPQNSQDAIDCWDAYNFFASEAVTAKQQCELEPVAEDIKEEACTNFHHWEHFVRQLEATGSAKELVMTILTLKRAKENPIDSTDDYPVKKSSIIPVSKFLDEDYAKKLCKKLFDIKDKNKDGKINVEEFRALMKLLGDEVHGDTISVMFESLGIHGSLDFDEFYTILEAESIRSHSQAAGVLRSAQRHGHSGDRPKWLDNV